MSCFEQEPSCVKYLRNYFQKKYPRNKIRTHRKFERKFSSIMNQFFREPPPKTQEIDLISASTVEGKIFLEGIEVKYFKIAKEGRNYYDGFGQSVGLLLWGFDQVTLLHVFDQIFDEEERKRFVRTSVELADNLEMLTYRAFLTRKAPEIQWFQLDNYGNITERKPKLGRSRKYPNPFVNEKSMDPKIKRRRRFIETEVVRFVP